MKISWPSTFPGYWYLQQAEACGKGGHVLHYHTYVMQNRANFRDAVDFLYAVSRWPEGGIVGYHIGE